MGNAAAEQQFIQWVLVDLISKTVAKFAKG